MNAFLLSAAVGLLLVFWRGAAQEPKAKGQEPGAERALLIGDSTAVGLTAPLKARASAAGFQFQSLATTGTRIDQWAASAVLDKVLSDFSPTIVFISLGTNDDVMGPGAVEHQRAALRQLLGKMSGKGPDIVWIGSLKPGPVSNMVASMLGDVYFHSERVSALAKAPDGIHATPAGYVRWAEAVWSGQSE